MWDLWFLGFAAISTSAIAAVVGLGGGMLLLMVTPFFLPVAAIVPIHGASQFMSNVSRYVFIYPSVNWSSVPAFFLGSLFGCCAFGFGLQALDASYIPIAIGIYMIGHLWWPRFQHCVNRIEHLSVLGFIQTGLGLIVGATGPLTTTWVLARTSDREKIVATNALLMSISHGAKLGVFALLGFQYSDYLNELCALCSGAAIGSYLGTRIRKTIRMDIFAPILKIVLTAMACRMIILGIL